MQLTGNSGFTEAGINNNHAVKNGKVAVPDSEPLLDRSMSFFNLPSHDPTFQAQYANDPAIYQLEIDVDARVSAARRSFCCTPCALPMQGGCCPCPITCCCFLPTLAYMYTCYRNYEAQLAAGHRLTLREKTLLYEVDPYYQPCLSEKPDCDPNGHDPWPLPYCFCGGCPCGEQCCARYVAPKPMVIRLTEIERIEVLEPFSSPCGVPRTAEHLVVTGSSNKPANFNNLWGGIGMSMQADKISVEGPKNAQAFIEAVSRQMASAAELDSTPAPKPLSMMQQLGNAAAAAGMGAAPPERETDRAKLIASDGGGGFCSQCGKAQAANARFCAQCGHAVNSV